MLILSNCLSDVVDEGCLNVANSLVKRIKATAEDVTVVSYERCSALTDIRLEINKLMLSGPLFRLLRQKKEPVLYIPFPAKPVSTAIRVFLLSLGCRSGLRVLQTMNVPMGLLAKILYRFSGAHFVVLNDEVRVCYTRFFGPHRVIRLKTGVDTKRFCPSSEPRAKELKEKYGFNPKKPLVLHVGHLTPGRNLDQLLKVDSDIQILLVTSTLTKNEQDTALQKRLLAAGNICIMDDYFPRIEEIYQMADVYFFPVVESGHCIDVPLSCLEAAACGIPVVTSQYGEMKAFTSAPGFYLLDKFDRETINKVIRSALSRERGNPRSAVLEYDWDRAVSVLNEKDY